ncbi:hypothetical protein PHMEG_00012736 [Phytophthora megakarya]|uniref:Uncharacterized protein n=1 Tax=Phytophthora megakarya TaxID=4795 RepID=A0A225WAL1_9STRA|nr:hypothetical protein PHMEG_00012736 [Phytophthora megakarya]
MNTLESLTSEVSETGRESSRPKKKLRSKENGELKSLSIPKNDEGKSTRKVQQGNPRTVTNKADGGCLKCKGDHWLVKCPVATQEEKVDLLRQKHERRAATGRSKKGEWRMKGEAHQRMPSRTPCTVDGQGRVGETEKLDNVVDVRTAGGHTLHATGSVKVKLQMNTAASPVVLRLQ